MSHPVNLLNRELTTNPARPFITYYDDASDERVDLSLKTFHNWVAKTANLLRDGLDTAPGDRVALILPAHWQHAVWLFACWSAGLVPVPAPESADAGTLPGFPEGKRPTADAGAHVIAISGELLPELAETDPLTEVVGLSLNAFGAPLADCPPDVTDYAVEVRVYGDAFTPAADPAAIALASPDGTLTGAELADAAVAAALPSGTRLLTTAGFGTAREIVDDLLAPLAAGGSIVLCRHLDAARLARRREQEHVTAISEAASPADGVA
jgi:uncharacterized protein (TIGR03089 family)